MNCIEIKLTINKDSGFNTKRLVMNAIANKLENPFSYNTIEIGTEVHPSDIKEWVKAEYSDTEFRDGVAGGCYGMRDGSSFKGLTLWMHPTHATDRCVFEGFEYANVYHSILENGGKLIEGLDGDALLEALELLGIESKRDNSYNSSGHGNVEFIFDFDFKVIEHNDKALLIIKFHCGGDIRGNYTPDYVYSFNSTDDLYSTLMPTHLLIDENAS
jgi:hypothetical protein